MEGGFYEQQQTKFDPVFITRVLFRYMRGIPRLARIVAQVFHDMILRNVHEIASASRAEVKLEDFSAICLPCA